MDDDLIMHRLYKDNCIFVDDIPVKDLKMIRNRDINKIIIVDSNP